MGIINYYAGELMINVFTRPITGMETTGPNLLHNTQIKMAKLHITKLITFHESSGYIVPSDHSICNLIAKCDRGDYDELSEYLRVVIPTAEYSGRIMGMASELYARDVYHQELTGPMNNDVIVTITDYSSTEILKCISHPWTYIDYRLPDNTWVTPPAYTMWTLNLAALFAKYHSHRGTTSISTFVHAHVIAPSIQSIVEQSLVNRSARTILKEPYDKGVYSHPRFVYPDLEKLDRYYKDRLIAPDVASALNSFPSVSPLGQFNTQHLPQVYQSEHIDHLWLLARVPTIVAAMQSSRPMLHRLERSNIHILLERARRFARKQIQLLPAQFRTIHSINIAYLRSLT